LRLRWIVAPVLAGAAYFALFGGEYGLLELRRLDRQQQEEAAQIQQVRTEVERLRARADSLENDSATLARLARERYGMIRDGERLYRFGQVDSADSATPAGRPASPAGTDAPARGSDSSAAGGGERVLPPAHRP
jgi:cell division protein FtsB